MTGRRSVPVAIPWAEIRRAALTTMAQGLSSLTNFLASAFALAVSDLEQFGQFSIVVQLCVVVVAVGRASIGVGLLIQAPGVSEARAWRLYRGAAGVALWLGVATGLGLAALGLLAGGQLRLYFLLAGLAAPALVAQYAMREYYFARGRSALVVALDGVWLATVLAVGLCDLVLPWRAEAVHYLGAWLAGAALSAVPMLSQSVRARWSDISMFGELVGPQAVRIGIDALIARSIFAVTLWTTQLIVGGDGAGQLAAAALIFSPLSVVNSSAPAVVVPSTIRRRGIHVTDLSILVVVATVLSLFAGGWALIVVGLEELGLAFGPFALAANGVSIGLFLATMTRFHALAVWQGPNVGVRIADAAQVGLDARIRGALAQWVLPPIGLVAFGVTGGAAGLAAGTWIGAAIAWQRFLRLRRAERR